MQRSRTPDVRPLHITIQANGNPFSTTIPKGSRITAVELANSPDDAFPMVRVTLEALFSPHPEFVTARFLATPVPRTAALNSGLRYHAGFFEVRGHVWTVISDQPLIRLPGEDCGILVGEDFWRGMSDLRKEEVRLRLMHEKGPAAFAGRIEIHEPEPPTDVETRTRLAIKVRDSLSATIARASDTLQALKNAVPPYFVWRAMEPKELPREHKRAVFHIAAGYFWPIPFLVVGLIGGQWTLTYWAILTAIYVSDRVPAWNKKRAT